MSAATVVLALARLGPLALLCPALGRGLWARLVVGTMLVAVVALNLPPATVTPALLVRELVIGLVLAVVAAVPFWAAELAGGVVDRARGVERGPLGVALGLWSLALWCGLGGPRLLVTAIGATYAAIPVGSAVLPGSLLTASGRVVGAGLAMAAPTLAVVLLVDLASSLLLRHDGHGDSVRGVRSLVATGALALTGAVALAVLGSELGALRTLGLAP